ncbi:MAG: hypothetical protein V3U87_13250 [Methylococcaceae bacterium]
MIFVGWANGSIVNPTFLIIHVVGLPKRRQPNLQSLLNLAYKM